MDNVQQAPIILLKEGTDTSQGKPQLVSNINACQAIVDAVRTTLGPRGMDKLIVDASGYILTIRKEIHLWCLVTDALKPLLEPDYNRGASEFSESDVVKCSVTSKVIGSCVLCNNRQGINI